MFVLGLYRNLYALSTLSRGRVCRIPCQLSRRAHRLGYRAMSLSPKTIAASFSVADILNPIVEDGVYSPSSKKSLQGLDSYLPPYWGAATSASTMNPAAFSSMNGGMGPYNYMQLNPAAAAYPSQCYGSPDINSFADPMGQRNSTATWYGANAADPRLASKS